IDCSEIQFLMPLYLSSELDATPMFDFELHLRQCAACARELEEARRCDDLLRDAFNQQSLDADELRRRVRTQISKTKRRRFLFRRPLYTLPIAASLLAAVALGILTVFPGKSSPTVYAGGRGARYGV